MDGSANHLPSTLRRCRSTLQTPTPTPRALNPSSPLAVCRCREPPHESLSRSEPDHEAAQYALGTALMRTARTEEGLSVLQEFERLQTATRARNDAAWQIKLLTEQAREHAARQEYCSRSGRAAPRDGLCARRKDRYVCSWRVSRQGREVRGGHSTVEGGIGSSRRSRRTLSRGRVRRVGATRGESCASRGVQGRQLRPACDRGAPIQ